MPHKRKHSVKREMNKSDERHEFAEELSDGGERNSAAEEQQNELNRKK